MTFWHNTITDKSFSTLKSIRQEFPFILIGGWAVYLHTRQLKSKDIDIIIDFGTLGSLKTKYNVIKNERLKKYEIPLESFDIDIYVPEWSDLGILPAYIKTHSISIDGYTVPQCEILLALKLYAYTHRKGSLKGKKDAIDILSLISLDSFSEKIFLDCVKVNKRKELLGELYEVLDLYTEVPELGMKQKKYADLKRKVKKGLSIYTYNDGVSTA